MGVEVRTNHLTAVTVGSVTSLKICQMDVIHEHHYVNKNKNENKIIEQSGTEPRLGANADEGGVRGGR